MAKKIIYFILLTIAVLALIIYALRDNNKLKLMREMIGKPLPQVIDQYAVLPCNRFNDQEKKQGYFDALVTGYCRPLSAAFKVRHDFLCAVGLNCTCPDGREDRFTCGSSGLTWGACKDFNDQKKTYCNQTATFTQPIPGTAAADWSCFPAGSQIEVAGQKYTVTDKGSAIKGRRVDLWFDDCQAAFKAIGIYQVKIPL